MPREVLCFPPFLGGTVFFWPAYTRVGSPRRRRRFDAAQGSEPAIAAVGGHFTQAVDREVMTYSATVLKDDVPKAMAVLADAVKVRAAIFVRLCWVLCRSLVVGV